MKNSTLLGGIALIAILLGSCNLSSGSDDAIISDSDMYKFQKVFMSSYYAERPVTPSAARALTPFLETRANAASRATVPVNDAAPLAFSALTSPSTITNYPEPGQTTTFTAVLVTDLPDAALRVYDITATTTYPSTDLRKNYVEEYYVQDIGLLDPAIPPSLTNYNTGTSPDGIWKVADPIVKKADGSWVLGVDARLTQDQNARIQQVLTFQDGTTRNEIILSNSNWNGPKFDPTAFDVNGSLFLDEAFIPATTTASDVDYSSVVYYYVTPATNPNFWFWQGSQAQTILGIRYYTEVQEATGLISYTVAFEKTLSTLTTTGGDFINTLTGIYAGSVYDTLAESVFRQKVNNTTKDVTSNMKTRVVNISGQKDFYLTQLNSDSVALTAIDSTIYIPTGDVAEVLAADSSALTFVRDQQTTGTTTDGIYDFASTNSDASGLGDLATVFRSIIDEAAVLSSPTAPASNLMATTGVVAAFNGQQSMGTLIEGNTVSNNMGAKGTVEAWVYINAQTNTAGIVHKGVAVDFNDECFSLQGWNADGTFTIILNRPASAGGGYDQLIAATKLNTKKWYHIVATWDTTLGNSASFIRIYLNGALNKSAKPSNAVLASGYTQNTSAVLVGSQLPVSYSAAYGYFGLNGKVAGANVLATALTTAEVLEKYNASKNDTVNW